MLGMMLLGIFVVIATWTWKATRSTADKALALGVGAMFLLLGQIPPVLIDGLGGILLSLAAQALCIGAELSLGGRFRDQAMEAIAEGRE